MSNDSNSSKPTTEAVYLGYIVGGSLKDQLRVRLTVAPQQVQEGSFVVVEGDGWLFYGLVTDMQLGSTDPRFADEQTEERLPGNLSTLLHGQTLYTNLVVLPALMLESGPGLDDPNYMLWQREHGEGKHQPMPVKTIPSHHARVRMAGAGDIAEIFGDPGDENHFAIGTSREQGLPICINLKKFVQRSSGIFGATGTGKSFLTRIILAGLMKANLASVLIFDMHNEYGVDDTASDTNEKVVGLKTKFGTRVQLVGLGSGANIRGMNPDFNLVIAEKDITPVDIELLTRELNLKETTPTTLDALESSLGNTWYTQFKHMRSGAVIEDDDGKKIPAPDSVAFWANQNGVNVMAAEGLHSKLSRLFHAPYILENAPGEPINQMVNALKDGRHVVLSFGHHESDLDYLFVTNLLTRKIRAVWEKQTNEFRSAAQGSVEPRPLVIVVEEAHKLLNREMAAQTTFSTIARELRKYYVTLLIIDQRPSQIYDEVMSQLGTRISGWLGDDADISAVLSGLAGRDVLRGMLSRLQPKEEVLLLGWGVPMPLPIRSRRYDQAFWDDLMGGNKGSIGTAEAGVSRLFPHQG